MNYYYKFFMQSIASRRLTYRSNVTNMVKDTPPGMGIGGNHKVNTLFNMAQQKKQLKRPFSSKPDREQLDMDASLKEFLSRVNSGDLEKAKKNPEEALNNFMKEQYVTIALVNSKSVQEVEQLLAKQDLGKLNINELSLFAFYLGDLEGKILNPSKVNELLDEGLSKVQAEPQADHSANFIKSLGILCARQGFKVTPEQAGMIVDAASKLPASDDTIVETVKALTYILDNPGQEPQYSQAIQNYLANSGDDILMTKKFDDFLEIPQLLYFIYKSQYKNDTLISRLTGQLLTHELDIDTALNTILALNTLGHKDAAAFEKLFKVVIPHLDTIQPDNLASLATACVANDLASVPISKIITAILQDVKGLSIDSYIEMFRLLGQVKSKNLPVNLETALETLKRGFGGYQWGLKDLQTWDLISIISSLNVLRDKDVAFAHTFIKEIFDRNLLKTCDGLQLFMITKLLYNYSRIYEDAFVDAHKVCASRMMDIPPEYRQTLKEAFILRKDILPSDSPFFKI